MSAIETMGTTALTPWYGSARLVAEAVGAALDGCAWVGIGCAGGMCEARHVKARSMIVNDIHRHIVNLAMTVADPALNDQLVARLDATPFHPDVLRSAQRRCIAREQGMTFSEWTLDKPDLDWAFDYFVCCWMAHGGTAGKQREFQGTFSLRWDAKGGDSCRRFRSATSVLPCWNEVFERASFSTLDLFEFLDQCADEPWCGIYLDPPWFVAGEHYKFPFTEADHRRLAHRLTFYKRARIVLRVGDVPLMRELYPDNTRWRYRLMDGRDAHNETVKELLIVNDGDGAYPELATVASMSGGLFG